MKWKAFAIASLLINLGFASFGLVWRPYRETRLREVAGKFNGNAWELFTELQKQFFMSGYLVGYPTGHYEACSTAERISQPAWTWKTSQECRESAPKYSKQLDHYVEQINQYYERYPQDKAIGVFVLLGQFSDQRNRSFEEIHRRYTNKEPL
jgi:hypothetical protein